MFRPSLLPCACLALALGCAGLAAPVPAWSQDSSTQERLDRLERDLSMLQRQVYRGAPPPAMGAADTAAVNTDIRMDRLESQMRDLTGHLEEVMNQIAQIRQRVEQINSDVDMRFSQLGAGSDATAAAKPTHAPPAPVDTARAAPPFPPAPPGAAGEELTPPEFPPETASGPAIMPGTTVPPPSGPPSGPPPAGPGSGGSAIFGTLTPPGSPAREAERASAAPVGHSPPTPAGLLPSGSATGQYNHAFGLLRKADYPAAEAAFKAFIEQHPNDPMAGNAQYWLGEIYYTRSRFLDAASAFAEGYKRYPKSAKAADNLLELGRSLARANQKKNACLALAQLDHDFPHAGVAIKEHAAAEKKRLGC